MTTKIELFNDISIEHNTLTNVGSIDLNPGVWLLIGTANFAMSSKGYRGLYFAETSTAGGTDRMNQLVVSPSSDAGIRPQLVAMRNINSKTTIYFNIRQTSGWALDVSSIGVTVICLRQ